jgi:hypothetical protein
MTDVSRQHLEDLRTQAQYARERYRLYKAKALGQRPTSPARLRELERRHEQAQARLLAAEAEQQRIRPLATDPVVAVPPPSGGAGH